MYFISEGKYSIKTERKFEGRKKLNLCKYSKKNEIDDIDGWFYRIYTAAYLNILQLHIFLSYCNSVPFQALFKRLKSILIVDIQHKSFIPINWKKK